MSASSPTPHAFLLTAVFEPLGKKIDQEFGILQFVWNIFMF